MAKAVVPQEFPPVPEEASAWLRKLRAGSVYHLHSGCGTSICGSAALRDRHKTEQARHLGDMQYWGCCPRCFKKAHS